MMGIIIKDINVLLSLLYAKYDPKLIRLMIWWEKAFENMTITEGYRPQKHPNDLHGVIPVRATDLRSWIYSNPEWVRAKCNNIWEYDPNRPEKEVCVYHDSGSGKHFHIQVHPNTHKRYGTEE